MFYNHCYVNQFSIVEQLFSDAQRGTLPGLNNLKLDDKYEEMIRVLGTPTRQHRFPSGDIDYYYETQYGNPLYDVRLTPFGRVTELTVYHRPPIFSVIPLLTDQKNGVKIRDYPGSRLLLHPAEGRDYTPIQLVKYDPDVVL